MACPRALASIPSTWPDALFSIEVSGAADGQAVLNHRLDIAYEAELPGYVAYLIVSSHGDMTLYRNSARTARTSGTESYVVKPPLGSGEIIVLFANAPWDSFLFRAVARHASSAPIEMAPQHSCSNWSDWRVRTFSFPIGAIN